MGCKSSTLVKKFLISHNAFIALVALLQAAATWSPHWSLESKVIPNMLIIFLEITNFFSVVSDRIAF